MQLLLLFCCCCLMQRVATRKDPTRTRIDVARMPTQLEHSHFMALLLHTLMFHNAKVCCGPSSIRLLHSFCRLTSSCIVVFLTFCCTDAFSTTGFLKMCVQVRSSPLSFCSFSFCGVVCVAQMMSQLESRMNSVERVQFYSENTPQEVRFLVFVLFLECLSFHNHSFSTNSPLFIHCFSVLSGSD